MMIDKLRVFLFHRVSPQRDPLWDPMPPELFERIIRYLSRSFEVVPLESTLLGEHKPLGKKELCAITFDDGYKDFQEFAFPILKKNNAPSSMYIVTNCVKYQTPPWTYILDYHFNHSKILSLNLDTSLLPVSLKKANFDDKEDRKRYATRFKPFLKVQPSIIRNTLLKQALDSLCDVQVPNDLMLSWSEIRRLREQGVEIGSHTVNHPVLSRIESRAEIKEEITVSRQVIGENLGFLPLTLSYPNGSYNEEVKELTAEAGYKLGLAVNNLFFKKGKYNSYEIPRVELYNENYFKWRARISGLPALLKKSTI